MKSRRQNKKIKIASGEHNLDYLDLDGIIQIDLYNYFRREENLTSYKLQNVAAHFIGDMISEWKLDKENNVTKIKSKNLTGLQRENYVCFDMIGHSTDKYKEGAKFKVLDLNEKKGFMLKIFIQMKIRNFAEVMQG